MAEEPDRSWVPVRKNSNVPSPIQPLADTKREARVSVPDDLVRQELLDKRKEMLVKRLSQKREAERVASGRPKSVSSIKNLDLSSRDDSKVNTTLSPNTQRKQRLTKSLGRRSGMAAMQMAEMTAEEKEARKQLLLQKAEMTTEEKDARMQELLLKKKKLMILKKRKQQKELEEAGDRKSLTAKTM